jgi:hypothetical protein
MPGPNPYSNGVSVPLPSDQEIREVRGDAYDPAKTLNVFKWSRVRATWPLVRPLS